MTSATGWRSESYSYDATGNRTMAGYSTGTGNRLISDGNFNYTYDADGNMLTKAEIATGNVTTYTWDYRNRLTSVVVKDSNNNVIQQSNYTYDPFDRRIGTSFDPDGAGPQPAVQTKTVWDGLNPFADFNGAGALTNRYLERAAAVDQVMASFSATGVIGWHLADQLGSVRDIADQNGNVQDHVKYDSFGKVLSESNPANGDRFKFTGRELDGTGDYNYRARYYNPSTGRFTSEDPTGLAAGDTNVFRYTFNAPTASKDPSGLGIFDWIYTGMWNPPDDVRNAAMEAAGDYYLHNAGDTHAALNSIPGGEVVGNVLTIAEGEALHKAVMQNGRNQPPPGGQPVAPPIPVPVPPAVQQVVQPNNAPLRAPAQNPWQQANDTIQDYAPIMILIAGTISQNDHTSGEWTGDTPRPDLYRTGNETGVGPIRQPGFGDIPGNLKPGQAPDIVPDINGWVHPGDGGMSTYTPIENVPTTGRVWQLPGDQPLPPGLKATLDPDPPGHVTVGPIESMPLDQYLQWLEELQWVKTPTKLK